MKGIPNAITILRIILSIIILFVRPFSTIFLVVYLVCGLSDMIDGFIARKMNLVSKLGSILDSIADVVFVSVIFIVLLPIIKVPWGVMAYIVCIAIIRFISLGVVFYKYKAFAILHTYSNKFTGLVLFCFPLLYNYMDTTLLAYLLCIIASIAAIEELMINIKSKELRRDIRGIFYR